jgi:hypothetical protein
VILVDSITLFDAFDIGPKRFDQKDCGKHLHSYSIAMVPQNPSGARVLLVMFVTHL